MNGKEIETLAKKHPSIAAKFRGVFSSNTLPEPSTDGFYIANLDPDTEAGTHWIAMDVRSGKEKSIYFDSYGYPPCQRAFLHFLPVDYVHNNKRLQHLLSTACGQWCLYFLLRRAQNWSLNDIVKPFLDQGKSHCRSIINDHVVNHKVEKLFNTDLDVIDHAFATEQLIRGFPRNKTS